MDEGDMGELNHFAYFNAKPVISQKQQDVRAKCHPKPKVTEHSGEIS